MCFLLLAPTSAAQEDTGSTPGERAPRTASPTPPPFGACLQQAYPESICGLEAGHLVFCDGDRMQIAEVAAMFAERYPREALTGVPTTDPGRTRHEPLFLKLYGADKAAVRGTLATVVWMPKTVGRKLKVTARHGVAARLQKVSDELDQLPAPIRQIVADTSGTFVWRKIRGTDRLSMHSFAIAIDVGVPNADFWKWRKTYRNRIPLEVVAIFEKHGFIWGGKWLHFDTMHFEYRPELLNPLCAP